MGRQAVPLMGGDLPPPAYNQQVSPSRWPSGSHCSGWGQGYVEEDSVIEKRVVLRKMEPLASFRYSE